MKTVENLIEELQALPPEMRHWNVRAEDNRKPAHLIIDSDCILIGGFDK
jgi:hypothetical protein